MIIKKMCIQIQPEREATFNIEIFEESLLELNIQFEVSEGYDNGRYINYDIETSNLVITWSSIKLKLMNNRLFTNTSIITCQGNNGWDDYLLLHHFDKAQKIDKLQNH